MTVDRADAWVASATGTIRYWNICTDGIWVWSGFEPSDRLGVVYR